MFKKKDKNVVEGKPSTSSSKKSRKSKSPESTAHSCHRQRCCCTELAEMKELYNCIHCLRCKVERENPAHPEYHLTALEAKTLEEDTTLCAATLVRIQVQRDEMCKLMIELRDLNDLLAQNEELFSEAEKEITELYNEVVDLIEKMDCEADEKEKTIQEELDNAAWIKAVALECQEQDRLQKNIKRIANSVNTMKVDDKLTEETRREVRDMDTKLFCHAVQCIEKSLCESKRLLDAKEL